MCASVSFCGCVSECVCECGSALTPLRGGLVRDSMETLSERVSVREGREEKRGERRESLGE